MAEHLDDIAIYVSGEDTSELAKVKAELAYALSTLDREMAILATVDAKYQALIEAMEIIAGRRQCIDNLMSNQEVAEAALRASVGSTQQPDNHAPGKA